jgi:hypothetical protein
MAMIIERQFSTAGHLVRISVEKGASGWNIQEEFDSAVVHAEHCEDWHRVERAMGRLEMHALHHEWPVHVAHH